MNQPFKIPQVSNRTVHVIRQMIKLLFHHIGPSASQQMGPSNAAISLFPFHLNEATSFSL